jgi:hypothetical protein
MVVSKKIVSLKIEPLAKSECSIHMNGSSFYQFLLKHGRVSKTTAHLETERANICLQAVTRML